MIIVWDEPKRTANIAKHGLDFADLDATFFERSVIVPGKEGRSIAIGWLNGATTVVFASCGAEAISIASMRLASLRERRLL